ncbi:Uncharacterized protein Fot_12301 [Forsythia ovata]|uniref:Uncharacterized protein n=1 Tax=Forsythia ovata TaxID=205694 RepID=A0ABD1WM54_9LAMI
MVYWFFSYIVASEPQVDQTTYDVTTGVQDPHCNEHQAPEKVTKNIDFNWDEPIVNESDEADFNWDEPYTSDHIDFNWDEPILATVGEEQATEQPLHQATDHIDCNWDEPAVDDVHSNYRLSDELESLNSDEDVDEPRRRVREPIFNPKTDMSDLRFALGMKFEIVQVLIAALVEYSIKNGRLFST